MCVGVYVSVCVCVACVPFYQRMNIEKKKKITRCRRFYYTRMHDYIYRLFFSFLSLILSQLIRTAAVPCQSDRCVVHIAFPLTVFKLKELHTFN